MVSARPNAAAKCPLTQRGFVNSHYGCVFFFPLTLVAAVIGGRRWPVPWTAAVVVGLFMAGVAVAWTVQGFVPGPRDLLWLAAAAGLAFLSRRFRRT